MCGSRFFSGIPYTVCGAGQTPRFFAAQLSGGQFGSVGGKDPQAIHPIIFAASLKNSIQQQ
jgi:hypothetical protein